MPGQQNGLRVVPCSQPDPLEPPGTTAPVRGVIVLLGVYCCFHGLECGCEKEPRGADFARECEVRALVLRPQAASRRVLASLPPLGPLAHIGRLAGTPSPRLCGGDASPGCSSSEAAAVWALHQPSSPFEAGILCRPWHLRRSGASTSLMRIRASETLALGPVASVEASPLLCTSLCPSLKEGVCDDTYRSF